MVLIVCSEWPASDNDEPRLREIAVYRRERGQQALMVLFRAQPTHRNEGRRPWLARRVLAYQRLALNFLEHQRMRRRI